MLKTAPTFTKACAALSLYPGSKDLIAGWDGKSFAVITRNKETGKLLKELYDAAMRLDLTIGLGGGGPFKNKGLVLSIPSRWTAEGANELKSMDEEHAQLWIDWAATGMEDKLAAAGLKWYTLQPRRDGDTYSVWVSPMDQQKYESSWCTIEQLEQWIKGEGPMIRKDKK
jgi:hypothetical protein